MEDTYQKRTGFTGNVKDILKSVCEDFSLGYFISYEVVLVGYEDFNIHLKTSAGDFFVKIFAKFRTTTDCKRIVKVMERSLRMKVSLPKLYKSNQGYLYTIKTKEIMLRLCVMDFIMDGDIFTSKTRLNHEEIKYLVSQATLINSLNIKPKPIYDNWAIVNFLQEFKKKSKYLNSDDLELLEPLVADFEKLDIETLPHCFVHGDIIPTNVLKDNNGKLWIVDFPVANYYPRIQELAVLACDILFDRKSKTKSEQNLNLALKEYQKRIKLTKRELESLHTYIKLAHAMHVLCANYDKKVNNNLSKENEYFLELGHIGLKQMLENKSI